MTEVNVDKADLVIAVTQHQETNITTCIISKSLGAKKTVARIQNTEYLYLKNILDLKDLGIDISLFNGTWVDLTHDAPNLWEKNVTKDSILKLSKKYNAPYLLTYADHDLNLPVMYKGKYFSIYNLKNTDEKT